MIRILMKKILYLMGFLLIKIKYLIYKVIAIYNSDSVNNNGGYISGQTTIANPKNIFIGKGSSINSGEIRAGKNSKIVIGDNCIISYNVHIRTSSHNYKNVYKNIKDQGNFEKDIIIGNDVWIGHSVQIMPGIKIGNGAVIAAGAIVTHDVNEFDVVAGIPAKKIGSRQDEKNKRNNK